MFYISIKLMRLKKYQQTDIMILAVLGLILFFLVLSVLYFIIYLSGIYKLVSLQAFVPFIVFTGFFIFLIGAILLALSIFKAFAG